MGNGFLIPQNEKKAKKLVPKRTLLLVEADGSNWTAVHMWHVTCPTSTNLNLVGYLNCKKLLTLPLSVTAAAAACVSAIASFSSTATPASTCSLQLRVQYVCLIAPLYLCKGICEEWRGRRLGPLTLSRYLLICCINKHFNVSCLTEHGTTALVLILPNRQSTINSYLQSLHREGLHV